MGEFTHRYVQGTCPDCVLHVSTYPDEYDDPRGGWIDINVISSHLTRGHSRWRERLANAWAVLRNRYDWSGFQLEGRDQAEAFIQLVEQAMADTWPN